MIITNTYRFTTTLNGSLELMRVTLKDGVAWLIKPELPKSVYLDDSYFLDFNGLLLDRYDVTVDDVVNSMDNKILNAMEKSDSVQ